jgi:hypothetical protein
MGPHDVIASHTRRTQRRRAGLPLLIGTVLVAASGLIHVYLWADGYRNIATIGSLFFAQGMAGLVLAVVLVAYPRVWAAAVAVAYLVATAIAFALSATWGLFGFMDRLDAPWAGTSLIVECAGIVCLVVGGALTWLGAAAHGPGLAATTTRRERS